MNYFHPILSCQQAQDFERAVLKTEAQVQAAMQKVGLGLAEEILKHYTGKSSFSPPLRLLVLAGSGHNGGDALLAAAQLAKRLPLEVSILTSQGHADFKPLTQQAYETLQNTAAPVKILNKENLKDLQFHITLDGLLGMGFTPPLKESLVPLFLALKTHKGLGFKVSVDLPSALGTPHAFLPHLTLATGIAKSPLFQHPKSVGLPRYLDIGLFDTHTLKTASVACPTSEKSLIAPSIFDILEQRRPFACDKRDFGHLFIVGGSLKMPGALLMNLAAALRGGVGRLTAFVPETLLPHLAPYAPEVMWVPCPADREGQLSGAALPHLQQSLKKATAILIGGGAGRGKSVQSLFKAIASQVQIPCVVDADALDTSTLHAFAHRPSNAPPPVLTPHAGEYRRLGGAENQKDLQTLARNHQCIIVLKGPLTRIATSEHYLLSPYGSPVLARGGSGDLLAGLLAARLAQLPTPTTTSILHETALSVAWHGAAAEKLAKEKGTTTPTTTDLLTYITTLAHPHPLH